MPERFAADPSFAPEPEGVAYSAEMCQRCLAHETAPLTRVAPVLELKGWPRKWKGAPGQLSVCPYAPFLSGRWTASSRMAFLRI